MRNLFRYRVLAFACALFLHAGATFNLQRRCDGWECCNCCSHCREDPITHAKCTAASCDPIGGWNKYCKCEDKACKTSCQPDVARSIVGSPAPRIAMLKLIWMCRDMSCAFEIFIPNPLGGSLLWGSATRLNNTSPQHCDGGARGGMHNSKHEPDLQMKVWCSFATIIPSTVLATQNKASVSSPSRRGCAGRVVVLSPSMRALWTDRSCGVAMTCPINLCCDGQACFDCACVCFCKVASTSFLCRKKVCGQKWKHKKQELHFEVCKRKHDPS